MIAAVTNCRCCLWLHMDMCLHMQSQHLVGFLCVEVADKSFLCCESIEALCVCYSTELYFCSSLSMHLFKCYRIRTL